MVFSSLLFLFRFFPIVFICYYLAPRKLKNLVLFVFSLIFYAWGEPIYVILMIFSTIVDYINGMLVYYFKEKEKNNIAKVFVIASIIINLLLLSVFKYSDFIIENINKVFNLNIALTNLALPIGISFYTFQTMSYTIDIYRGEAKVQKNILSFGTYVALFPQLIAGPIVRYKTIAEQLNSRHVTIDKLLYGIMRFIVGLGKKVLLANNIGVLWSTISNYSESNLPMLTAWLGIIAFTFQIYFDFSGYSDMAIGLGAMFGFDFLENFNYPYKSKSITEFWRRWHISLGTWFKEYVYIPLGGNRKNQIVNILIVWILTGFWHGANWNFIFWGLYFAVILILEKKFLLKHLEKLPKLIQHFYSLILIICGWAIFAYPDMKRGKTYFKALLGLSSGGIYNTNTLYLLYTNIILLLIVIIGSTDIPKKICQKFLDNRFSIKILCQTLFIVIIFILSVAYLVNASYNPFLYFRF